MSHGASAPTLDDISPFALNTENTTPNNGEEETASSGGSSRERPATVQLKKRKEHLKQLITALDLLIYIQLVTTHYMDILFHAFTRAPSVGEATRGYMHGSLLLDFVGQKGPTSKIRLVALDVLVLGLQLLMLAVCDENKNGGHGHRRVSRVPDEDGMELQSLDPRARRDGGSSAEEGSNAVSMEMDNMLDNQQGEAIVAHPLDEMHGGQMIMAHMDIFGTVRNQFWDYRNGPRGGV